MTFEEVEPDNMVKDSLSSNRKKYWGLNKEDNLNTVGSKIVPTLPIKFPIFLWLN